MPTGFSPPELKDLLDRARDGRPAAYGRRVAELRDFWLDRTERHLASDIDATFTDPDIRDSVLRSGLTLPLVRRIVKKLTGLYREEPARRVRLRREAPEEEAASADAARAAAGRRYHALAQEAELSLALGAAEELHTLTGLAWVRVGWDGSLFFDTLAGDDLYAVAPPGAPAHDVSRYEAVLVPSGDGTFAYWSADHHFRFGEDGGITGDFGDPELKNPYGRIPFVRIDSRTGELYPHPPESLLRANRVLNFALTELFYTIKFQCFGQPVWVSDDDTRPDFKVGVQHLIHVVKRDQAAAGDFRFESPDAPVDSVKSAIFETARLAALLEGVPADTVDAEGRVESGVARWLARADSAQVRAAQAARFRTAERQVFETVAAVLRHHRPEDAPDTERFTLETDFAEPAPDVSPQEQRELDAADLALGVVSPLDLLRRRNPDLARLPDADVLALWRRNRELAGER